jgi:hypothetical protein
VTLLIKGSILLAHALVIWIACAATIIIGRAFTSPNVTLAIHAVVAPLISAIVSYGYFKRFNYSTPLSTGLAFASVPLAIDAILVAPVFEKSYAMFASVWGTWIPIASIFAVTWITGQAMGQAARVAEKASFRG